MKNRDRAAGMAALAVALLLQGLFVSPARSVVMFNWGSPVEAEAWTFAALRLDLEDGSEEYKEDPNGGSVPGLYTSHVQSDFFTTHAHAEAFLDANRIAVGGAADIGDGQGIAGTSGYAAEIVPFSVTGTPDGTVLFDRIQLDVAVDHAAVRFELLLLDGLGNVLIGDAAVIDEDLHLDASLAGAWDYEFGETYYMLGSLEGLGNAVDAVDPVSRTVDPAPQVSFDASLTWGRGVSPVPEPGSWVLLATGLAAVVSAAGLRRRRRS